MSLRLTSIPQHRRRPGRGGGASRAVLVLAAIGGLLVMMGPAESYSGGNLGTKIYPRRGHAWINHKAYEWLKAHQMLPDGLQENLVLYGGAFADSPWLGMPEAPGVAVRGPLDDVLQKGKPHHLERVCYHAGISKGLYVEFLWPKDVQYPALFARLLIVKEETEILANEAAITGTHYPVGEIRQPNESEIIGETYVGAADMGSRLYKLAEHFWPSPGRGPVLRKDLFGVPRPGRIDIHLPAICNDGVYFDYPPLFIGGNPFINDQKGNATWPIWVPDVYAPEKLLQDAQPPSKRASAIYLGWALHYLQDLHHPYHAVSLVGGDHEATEDLVNQLIDKSFDRTLPRTSGQYEFSALPVADTRFLDYHDGFASKQEMCKAFVAEKPWVKHFADAEKLSRVLLANILDTPTGCSYQAKSVSCEGCNSRAVTSLDSPRAQVAAAAYELLLDMAIKDTIRFMACLDVPDAETCNPWNCSDGNPCTTDRCTMGICKNDYIAGCGCQTDAACDDGNHCTKDTCRLGQCNHMKVCTACVTAKDCGPAPQCKRYSCAQKTCQLVEIPRQGACDDCDPCTKDRWEKPNCRHDRIPGCKSIDPNVID